MPYLNGKKILVPDLAVDGWNWTTYHEKLISAIKHEGLEDHLRGTAWVPFMDNPRRELYQAWEIWTKQILAITTPNNILEALGSKMLFEKSAYYFFSQLAYFVYSLTTTNNDDIMHTAAQSQKPFNGTCRKCGKGGHKARRCKDQGWVKLRGETYQKASEACVSLTTQASSMDSESMATAVHHAATDETPKPETASWMVNAETADAMNSNTDRWPAPNWLDARSCTFPVCCKTFDPIFEILPHSHGHNA